MKYFLFIFIIMVSILRSSAQSIDAYTQAIDITPPPPNATAIVKHGQLNINKNTGAPNINIPLFPVKGIKLNLNTSINYASTGIKVDEIASRVGMGWSIEAGGVVTRTVRGAPDEKSTRLTPPSTFDNNCETYNYFQSATDAVGPGDTEPDLFTFNMNGVSGSFVLDNNMQPVILSGQKFKIETNFLTTAAWNFKITTTDGLVYLFGGSGATEKTKRSSTCGTRNFADPIPVSWYLIKIQHPNGEYINLTYSAVTYSYDTGFSETQQWNYQIADINTNTGDNAVISCNFCTIPPPSRCVTKVTTNGVVLTGINSSSHYSLSVFYQSRTDCNDQLISQINYYGPDGLTGSFSFFYNTVQSDHYYYGQTNTGYDQTPYLVSLSENASTGAVVNQHIFTYNAPEARPPRLSYSQDHWGYFNGRSNSTSFIPLPATATLRNDFPLANANREAQEGYAAKGMLCKIQYPTGGSDTLIYENNKMTTSAVNPLHTLYGQSTGADPNVPVSANYTISIPYGQTVSLLMNCDSSGTTDHKHHLALFVLTGGGTTITSKSFTAGQSESDSFDLGAGTYTLQVQATGSVITARAIFTYRGTTTPGTLVDIPVGGVRVASVITSAAGQPAQIHKYFYGQLSTMNQSSLLNLPQAVYNVTTNTALACSGVDTHGNTFPFMGVCHGIAMYSSSMRNLYDFGGALASYPSVIESIGTNFEGGGIQSRFFTQTDAAGQIAFGHDIPNATQSNFSIFFNGKPREETLLKKTSSGTLIPVKTSLYTYKTDTTGQRTVRGYAVQMDYFNTDRIVGCSPNSNAVSPYYMNPFSALRYDNMTAWVYNDTLIVKTFDKNGLNPVIDTTVSVYNNPVNRQLTQSLTSTSAGAWKSEVHKYPNDYSTIPVYASMITKNIISPVVDITTYKGSTQLGEAKINYSDWGNGNYALSSVQKSFYGGPFTTEGTIDAYNKRGNITQYTGKDLVTTAILWGGYNGQYPVAKVIGATYAGAVSHLSVADTALYGMSEADIRTQIALIRTAMPGAHVTTYTFKQKTGVSSITDERSAISTFAYDSKDRLGSIFDLNGNIVKSYTYNFGIPTPDNTSGYFGNDYVQGSFTCQVCLTGYSAQAINYGIAANSYYSGTSKAEANAAANAALAFYGQLAANQFSECVKNAPVYWNVAQTRTFIKTCPANYTGTSVDYTVPAHTYSGPTQTDADALALYHVNTEGQAYADAGTHGTCNPNCTTGNCSGVDKKCVNGACETGQKVYTSSVQDHGSLWTCTYHYHWSDGTNSGDYTETSTSQCVNMEE